MITTRIVPESERLGFFPTISNRYIHVEAYIYNLAGKYITDYSGAYYEFIELQIDNEGPVIGRFAYPVTETGKVRLVNTLNYSDVILSDEAAGLAIFIMCYSDYSIGLYEKHSVDSENFTPLYFQLRNYALEHNEASEILAFLD
ncbi:antirestriction protein [Photobacterium frigidiphilum]|uniref:antirestriction protein n=1 Tax=Photobacterium frigidiphilum TaxID=264736 RepID=UPI003D1137E9